jgi:hypothetical protein
MSAVGRSRRLWAQTTMTAIGRKEIAFVPLYRTTHPAGRDSDRPEAPPDTLRSRGGGRLICRRAQTRPSAATHVKTYTESTPRADSQGHGVSMVLCAVRHGGPLYQPSLSPLSRRAGRAASPGAGGVLRDGRRRSRVQPEWRRSRWRRRLPGRGHCRGELCAGGKETTPGADAPRPAGSAAAVQQRRSLTREMA